MEPEQYVTIPVQEFERLHGEIKRLRQVSADHWVEIERQRAEIKRLVAQVDRLSRALSHA